MFIRENGLMFRTFAQFLFKMTFSRGAGGVQNILEIPEGCVCVCVCVWGGGGG